MVDRCIMSIFMKSAITNPKNEKSCCVLSKWSFVNRQITSCIPADYSKAADYSKEADYTCKLLNFRFTTYILITVLDTVEVTPFFSKKFTLVQ